MNARNPVAALARLQSSSLSSRLLWLAVFFVTTACGRKGLSKLEGLDDSSGSATSSSSSSAATSRIPGIAFSSPSASPGNDSTPTFTVILQDSRAFEAGDTVTLHQGADCSGAAFATVSVSGGTSTTLTQAPALADGSSTVFRVKLTSSTGTETCSTDHTTVSVRSLTYAYDGTAPAAPVVAMAAGASNPDVDSTPALKITLNGGGNFSDADTVTLYEGGNNTCNGTARGSSTISGAATSSVNITPDTALSTFGANNYFAKVTDTAGNSTCAAAALSFTYKPTAASSVGLQSPSTSPGNDTTPTIRVSGGSVVNGATVTLYSDSSCSTAVSSATASTGTSVDVTTNALTAGSYLFYAIVSKDSTNSACSSVASTYVLDTTAPTAPGIALSSPSTSPSSDSTPTFAVTLLGGGNFAVADTITLHEGADCSGSSVASVTGVSTASTTITRSSAMAVGTTTFRIKVTDEAGNVTCSTSHTTVASQGVSYEYDSTLPAAPGIELNSPSTSPGTDSTPTFTITLDGGGNFAAGHTITLHEGADCSGASVASSTGNTGSSITLTRSSAMSETTTVFRAKVTVGGYSICSTSHATTAKQGVSYQYDVTAPVYTSIARSSPTTVIGSSSTPAFTITNVDGSNFAASDTITLHNTYNCSDSAVGTIGGSGTNSVTVTRSAMSEGSQIFYVKVTDGAGNATCTSARSPSALNTGLKLWLKADSGVYTDASKTTSASDTSAVYTWADQSGNAYDAIQATSSKQPAYDSDNANGMPALTFGSDGADTMTFTNMTDIRTIFWVIKPSFPASGTCMFLLGDDGAYNFHDGCVGTTKWFETAWTGAGLTGGAFYVNGTTTTVNSTSRASSNGVWSMLSMVTSSSLEASQLTQDRNDTARSLRGDFAELIIYNTALSDSDRKEIERYLAAKYQLTSANGKGGLNYSYDASDPTWANTLSHDATYSSLTESPPVTWTANASDAGSGIAGYQYAVGTGTSGASITNLKSWTNITSGSWQATGLSLTANVQYYVHMRAYDNAGRYSAVYSSVWEAQNSPGTVAPRYTNAQQWNDFVRVSDGTTACDGTETSYVSCTSGGGHRKVNITTEADCTGLTMTDSLGAFDWTCTDNGADITFYGSLKSTKSLRDLIDFNNDVTPAFRSNKVTLSGCVNCPMSSVPAVWWNNPVKVLPDNSATTTSISLDTTDDDGAGNDQAYTAKTIFTLANSRTTAGYNLNADKFGIVLDSGVTLTWNNSTNNTSECGFKTVLCVYGQKFNYFEGNLNADGVADATHALSLYYSTVFFTAGNVNTTGATHGLVVYSASKMKFGNVTSTANTGSGLFTYATSYLTFGDLTLTNNTGSFDGGSSGASNGGWQGMGVSTYITTGNITATGNTGAGLSSTNNNGGNNYLTVNGTINASNNSKWGIYALGATNWTVSGTITANSNTSGGVYLQSMSSGTYGNITANANGGSGLHTYFATTSTFGTLTLTNNTGTFDGNVWTSHAGLYLAGGSSNLTIAALTSTGNTGAGITSVNGNGDSDSLTFTGNVVLSNNGKYGLYNANNSANGWAFNGTLTADSNGADGLYLQSFSGSTFGTVSASSNAHSGILFYFASSLTFGTVTANSNAGATTDSRGGISLFGGNSNITFSNVTASNNTGYGIFGYVYNGATSNITFTGDVVANSNAHGFYAAATCCSTRDAWAFNGTLTTNYNTNHGVYFGITNTTFNKVYTSGNGGAGFFAEGGSSANLTVNEIYSAYNRSATAAGVHLDSTLSGSKIGRVVSIGNTQRGFYAGTPTYMRLAGPVLVAQNGSDGVYVGGSYNSLANITALNNSGDGVELNSASYFVLHNLVATNNGAHGLFVNGGSQNTISQIAVTQNATNGVQLTSSTSNKFTGLLLTGNNSGSACGVSAGTNPGLINTTCSDSGATPSTSYTGQASNATYRAGYDFADSFARFVSSPGDTANTSDGAAGSGTGTATFSVSLDFLNFDNIFRGWAKSTAQTFPHSDFRGYCTTAGTCQIFDYSLSQNDTKILNKSGNGDTYNNGAMPPVAGVNSFTAAAACPSEVASSNWVNTQSFSYSASYTGGLNGPDTNGDGDSVCETGETCRQQFLVTAYEVHADSLGDDDGLCEKGETCIYAPNLGAYQGHDTLAACTQDDSGGGVTGATIKGYSSNGR